MPSERTPVACAHQIAGHILLGTQPRNLGPSGVSPSCLVDPRGHCRNLIKSRRGTIPYNGQRSNPGQILGETFLGTDRPRIQAIIKKKQAVVFFPFSLRPDLLNRHRKLFWVGRGAQETRYEKERAITD